MNIVQFVGKKDSIKPNPVMQFHRFLAIGSASGIVRSRHQATGMWQSLLEQGVIQHGIAFVQVLTF